MSSAAEVVGSAPKSCERKGICGCGGAKSPAYLGALTLIAWGVQIPMLLFAVPKFAERLGSLGVQVPGVSRLVINWSDWMQAPVGSTIVTGTMVYAAAIFVLAIAAFAIAKIGGGFGRAVVVMVAMLGGAIACGQAAAVIVPTMMANTTIENAEVDPAL